MSECARCNGDGEIDGCVETVPCPNCEDVCQWCNNEYDDGEPLGDTGLAVCRDCIRDMARYKEDVPWQLFVTTGIGNVIENPDELRTAMSKALRDAFAEYGVDLDTATDEWEVRSDE